MACAAVLFCVSFENTPLEPYRVTSTGQSEAASSAPAASALSEANGGYKDVRELTNVKGIGEKLLEKLLPYVMV